MGLSCPRCQAQISLAAERIPGKYVLVTCQACRAVLGVEYNVRLLQPYPGEVSPAASGPMGAVGAPPTGCESPAEFDAAALRDRVLNVLQGEHDEIPVLNRVALKIRTLTQDPRRHSAEIASLLRNDQALASRLVRLANSAYYGRAEPVGDIGQALRCVGFKAVETLVLVASTQNLFRPRSAAEAGIMAGLWDHGLAAAAAAKWIARETRKGDPERAFLTGLLHDIGRALGLRVLGESMERNPGERRTLPAERIIAIIDVHHAELGAMLLEKWAFPPDVVMAVRAHHAPLERPGDESLPVVVALADSVATKAGLDVGPLVTGDRGSRPLAARLGLTDAKLESLEVEVGDLHAEMKRLLAA